MNISVYLVEFLFGLFVLPPLNVHCGYIAMAFLPHFILQQFILYFIVFFAKKTKTKQITTFFYVCFILSLPATYLVINKSCFIFEFMLRENSKRKSVPERFQHQPEQQQKTNKTKQRTLTERNETHNEGSASIWKQTVYNWLWSIDAWPFRQCQWVMSFNLTGIAWKHTTSAVISLNTVFARRYCVWIWGSWVHLFALISGMHMKQTKKRGKLNEKLRTFHEKSRKLLEKWAFVLLKTE